MRGKASGDRFGYSLVLDRNHAITGAMYSSTKLKLRRILRLEIWLDGWQLPTLLISNTRVGTTVGDGQYMMDLAFLSVIQRETPRAPWWEAVIILGRMKRDQGYIVVKELYKAISQLEHLQVIHLLFVVALFFLNRRRMQPFDGLIWTIGWWVCNNTSNK